MRVYRAGMTSELAEKKQELNAALLKVVEKDGAIGCLSELLTQNLHLAPSTQQAEQAGFTREEITRRASQFSLKINKRQSS
jgi:hypothetical protein